MIRFLDGPAIGETLQLRRVQIMLRVVRDSETGAWDALNDPADVAKPTEEIFVYRMVPGTHGSVHINTGQKPGGGMYALGDYRLWPKQPGDAHTRTLEAWRAWCDANRAELTEGFDL